MAPAGQEREVTLDLTLDLTAGAAEERAQFSVESELATMVSDEVDDGAEGLATRTPQASAELLQEQRRALSRTKQQ